MSTVKIQGALQTPKHVRALLSGGLGVFSSLLAIGWALWAYNLPSAVNVTSSNSQNLMLAQLVLAFIMLLGSGLMLARFTLPGGIVNVLGALSTFLIGVYFSSGIADAARSKDLNRATIAVLRRLHWNCELSDRQNSEHLPNCPGLPNRCSSVD